MPSQEPHTAPDTFESAGPGLEAAVRRIGTVSVHRLVFLWCHPRSLSSALERVMLERGDMTTLHEPFLYLYYVHDARKRLPHLDVDPHRSASYEDIRSAILDAARTRPVFVKDMCYYVRDRIHDDVDFIRRMTSTFLIRDPARSIPSYFHLAPGVTLEEIGHEAQYRCFERIREVTGRTPVVIDAADLASDPAGTVRAYCRVLEVPFMPRALAWDAELPEAWRDVSGWHAELAGSRGIARSRSSRGPDLDAAPHLRRYYEHHLPFYREMRTHRLAPVSPA